MSFSLDQLLIFAARARNRALTQERLAKGANPNYLDPLHGSAAMEAVRHGDGEMLSLLIDAGMTPDSPAAQGQGGLIEGALEHQQPSMAVLLAHRGFRLLPHARPVYRERLQSALAGRPEVEPSAVVDGGAAPRSESYALRLPPLSSLDYTSTP